MSSNKPKPQYSMVSYGFQYFYCIDDLNYLWENSIYPIQIYSNTFATEFTIGTTTDCYVSTDFVTKQVFIF